MDVWRSALVNSLVIGTAATALATFLGTLAALGLSSPHMPARRLLMGFLVSPLVTPVIISAAGMFFFYSRLGLGQTHLGLILAHARAGDAVRGDHGDRHPDRLQHHPEPCSRVAGRGTAPDLHPAYSCR